MQWDDFFFQHPSALSQRLGAPRSVWSGGGGQAAPAADACRQLATGLRYYFGVAALPVHLVAGLVYGLDFDAIKSTLGIPEVRQARPLSPIYIQHSIQTRLIHQTAS